MKPTLIGLAAFAAALFVLHHAPLHRSPAPSVEAINAIVGDASFRETFGRDPGATTDEDLRIRTHLTYVLNLLRVIPSEVVAPDLRAARAKNLARLERYIAIGEFPRNPAGTHGRTPNFLDASGRICAVGYLVREDLGPGAIEAINARYQFARISDMESETLAAWQVTSGLTLRELAMIQPAYCDDGKPCGTVVFDDTVLPNEDPSAAHVAVGTGSVVLGAFNVASIGRSERRTLLALGGIGVGVAGLVLASDEEAPVPAFNAVAGLFSLFAGTIQLVKPREAKATEGDESGLSQVQVAPVLRDGERMLAVQVRF